MDGFYGLRFSYIIPLKQYGYCMQQKVSQMIPDNVMDLFWFLLEKYKTKMVVGDSRVFQYPNIFNDGRRVEVEMIRTAKMTYVFMLQFVE